MAAINRITGRDVGTDGRVPSELPAGRGRNMHKYFKRLKSVNRYKIMSVIAHLNWLFTKMEKSGTARQIKKAEIYIDREDFPLPSDCANFLKRYLSAGLQAAGMSLRLTGKSYFEHHDQGAILVKANSDSNSRLGLQAVDILLQAVQRKLPGYRKKRD